MRAVIAAALSLFLVLLAIAPHVHHEGPHGTEECAVCVSRGADVPRAQTPDVEPVALPAGDAPLAPGLAPVAGAPLGAVPGQSPPRA
jgi:hypothetical protein